MPNNLCQTAVWYNGTMISSTTKLNLVEKKIIFKNENSINIVFKKIILISLPVTQDRIRKV